MRPEHDVAGNSPRLADQHLWSAEDNSSTEREVGSFLHSLVIAIKPFLVVETGCYTGRTSERILNALCQNGIGEFTGCEPELVGHRATVESLSTLCCPVGVTWRVKRLRSHGIREFIETCDLLFSDSDPKVRPEEVSWLKPGAIAVVHDTYVYPELGEFVKCQGGILFDTPRGFGMIRK